MEIWESLLIFSNVFQITEAKSPTRSLHRHRVSESLELNNNTDVIHATPIRKGTTTMSDNHSNNSNKSISLTHSSQGDELRRIKAHRALRVSGGAAAGAFTLPSKHTVWVSWFFHYNPFHTLIVQIFAHFREEPLFARNCSKISTEFLKLF